MPRVQPKPKIDPDTVYVAWTSFGVDDHEFPGGVVKLGAELRGSHTVVQNHPNYFVLADTPRSEWPPEHWITEVAQDVPGEYVVKVPEYLPAEELAEAVTTLHTGFGRNRIIKKGERLPKNHPLVVNNREWFKDVEE